MAEPAAYYRQFCMSSLLHISSVADLATVRAAAITYTFGGTLPSTGADTITTGVSAFYSTDPGSNCSSVDKWTFTTGNRLSFAFVYHPAVTPIGVGNKLALVHHGHEEDNFGTGPTVNSCVTAGLTAIELFMPGASPDNGVASIGYGPNTTYHNCLTGAELGTRFLSPTIRALNQAVTNGLGTQGVGMIGVSGGGWASVMIPAVDTRISISYPCSGSYPNCLRIGGPNLDVGDVEQNDIADAGQFYSNDGFDGPNTGISRLDLFLLGACGTNRKQVECSNPGDVHNGGWLWVTYENLLRGLAAKLGGSFAVNVKDPSAAGHFLWQQWQDAFVADMTQPVVRSRFRRGRR